MVFWQYDNFRNETDHIQEFPHVSISNMQVLPINICELRPEVGHCSSAKVSGLHCGLEHFPEYIREKTKKHANLKRIVLL